MISTPVIARYAPLVRGLFLRATGAPVFLVPGEEPARVAAMSQDAERPTAMNTTIDLAGASEKEAAAILDAAFARAGAVRDWLPGCLSIGTDEGSVSFYAGLSMRDARGRAAERDAAFWNPLAAAAPGGDSALPGFAGSARDRSRVVENRIACVTGGAQGFGEEIVRGLAASGAYVFIADMNIEGARRLADSLNSVKGSETAAAIAVNVADEESVRSMFASIAAQAGGIDLVVSNAGVLKASSVLDQDYAAFKFVTDVNYTAFMLVTKHSGLLMRAQSRTSGNAPTDIIQINSKSGLQGSNKNGSYAGSKFGSIGLVQSYALELVEYGVKVNAICPGNFFDGPLWSDPVRGLFVQYLAAGKVPGAKTVADVKAFYEAKVPMGRGCTGADVMRAIYYLVDQVYETGQALPVTGGQVMLS